MSSDRQHVMLVAYDDRGRATVIQGTAVAVDAAETEPHGYRPGVDRPGSGATLRLTIRFDDDGYENLITVADALELTRDAAGHWRVRAAG